MLWKDPMFWKMLGYLLTAVVAGLLADAWWKRRENEKRLREGRAPETYEWNARR